MGVLAENCFGDWFVQYHFGQLTFANRPRLQINSVDLGAASSYLDLLPIRIDNYNKYTGLWSSSSTLLAFSQFRQWSSSNASTHQPSDQAPHSANPTVLAQPAPHLMSGEIWGWVTYAIIFLNKVKPEQRLVRYWEGTRRRARGFHRIIGMLPFAQMQVWVFFYLWQPIKSRTLITHKF